MASVLADFTARFRVESSGFDGPTEGRILLGKDQLVLAAADDQQLNIPLSSVIDISPDSVPMMFDPLPGTPVTIAFKEVGQHQTVLVAADEQSIEKFTMVLFKALLNGTHMTLKHPAKLGGRVLDTAFRGGILGLESGAVKIETEDGPVRMRLDGVIDFRRETRTVNGHDQPVLVVDHIQDGETLTTVAATESNRKLSILGRFLRREYEEHIESLQELSLSEAETEMLTTIYSGSDREMSLANVLEMDPDRVKRLLHDLHENDLIEAGEQGPILTTRGQVVVTHYLERVNA